MAPGLATVVEVNLAEDGGVDLAHLESLLQDPAYQGRMRIGSFSAASNVTGLRSPVPEIACLLHAHGAYACFDYAASAPYVEIDMNQLHRRREIYPAVQLLYEQYGSKKTHTLQ